MAATHPDWLGTSAVILAGGKSRRLGRDKAVEIIGGQPLIRRVIDRIGLLLVAWLKNDRGGSP